MRTLAGWILGVFALGLVVGGIFGGTSAGERQRLVDGLAEVDCGPDRDAVLVPAIVDGTSSVSVKCVSTAPARRAAVAAPRTENATPSPVRVPVRTATSESSVQEPSRVQEAKTRDWKDTALVIGGAAGAGAGIGAIAKGGRGAAVGAAIGGVAGTVYELARKKK